MWVYLGLQRFQLCIPAENLVDIIVVDQVLDPPGHGVKMLVEPADLIGPLTVIHLYFGHFQLCAAEEFHFLDQQVKIF